MEASTGAEPPSSHYSEEVKASAREKHLQALEQGGRPATKRENEERGTSESKEHGVIGEINAAARTIQVIGQILRNFPGSLRAEVKLGMATKLTDSGFGCYTLSCATLGPIWKAPEPRSTKLHLVRSPGCPVEGARETHKSTEVVHCVALRLRNY